MGCTLKVGQGTQCNKANIVRWFSDYISAGQPTEPAPGGGGDERQAGGRDQRAGAGGPRPGQRGHHAPRRQPPLPRRVPQPRRHGGGALPRRSRRQHVLHVAGDTAYRQTRMHSRPLLGPSPGWPSSAFTFKTLL